MHRAGSAGGASADDVRPRLDAVLPAQPSGARIFDRFLAACRARPDATAIVHPRGAWSYAQLERASRALAGRLLDQPVDDDVVALYARRSGELVAGMLACLRAGLTFAVLDAAYPVERLAQLLEVMRPGRLLAIGAAADDAHVLAQLAVPPSVLRLGTAAIDDALRDERPDDARLDHGSADAIAYLLFTSGTTGVPRCIATSHAPLAHFIDWYEQAFAVDARARFSMLSGVAHDPILRDVFVPLSTGGELHVPPQASVLDPEKLHAWFADTRVSHAHVTPQLCRILCAGSRDQAPLVALRFVLSGGDTLRTEQARDLLAAAPGARVVNFYGATETPQAMGHHVFDPGVDGASEVVPVGRGIADVQLAVLDDALALAAVGARGQIAIRTRFLSAGYRGDVGLTARKFIANPYTEDPADQLYLTGDVGRFRPDGAVVVEGRVDDQVKIRGFRVELGDVVHHLERIAQVKEAVVLAEPTPDGDRRLVAYVVARPGVATGAAATATVRAAMSAASPAYLVPARFVWLPRFPLLPNGKLDRVALGTLEDPAAPALPVDAIEAQIAAQWRALLAIPAIDVGASFVDLGGDSLSFIAASMQLHALLGALPDGWDKLSIRELARQQRDHRSRWTRIESSVLLRAVSIIAVVAGHFDLPNLTGSVRALFVVSGMSFGRYLVPQVVRTERVAAITRLVRKIAVPAVLYTLVVNIAFGLPRWPGMLLINNLVSPDAQDVGVGFWFIDVLVQSLLVLAALLSLRWVRRLVSRDPFRFALGATAVFAGVALVAPMVWDTSALYDRVPQQYLGALCLGWAVAHADSRRRQLLVVAATVLTFAQPAWTSEDPLVFPFVATVFLVFVPRVALPVHAGRLVHLIAGASLFIYLTDHQTELIVTTAGLGDHRVAMVVLAVIVGLGVWKAWDVASSLAMPWQRKHRGVAVGALPGGATLE